jgi:TetR/AcrR family transcriptional regulator
MIDNRSNILACALDLFANRGYDAVGVQDIADAAGIKKPTLYHYFGSKQGLLQELLASSYEPLNEAVRQAADYHGDLPLTLRKVAWAFFEYALQNPERYRLQLSLWFAPRESEPFRLVAHWSEQQHSIIEDMFIKAAENHGNMRGRHKYYAASFTGMVNSCIALALNGYAVLDQDLLDHAVRYFEHGIYS